MVPPRDLNLTSNFLVVLLHMSSTCLDQERLQVMELGLIYNLYGFTAWEVELWVINSGEFKWDYLGFLVVDFCHNPNSTSTQLNSWV